MRNLVLVLVLGPVAIGVPMSSRHNVLRWERITMTARKRVAKQQLSPFVFVLIGWKKAAFARRCTSFRFLAQGTFGEPEASCSMAGAEAGFFFNRLGRVVDKTWDTCFFFRQVGN